MGKPDMTIPSEAATSHPTFIAWKAHLTRIAAFPRVAVKMSGVFSELDTSAGMWEPETLEQQVLPWVTAVFEIFGADRVMWASDWPVCNIGYGGKEGAHPQYAWSCWRQATFGILGRLVARKKLTEKEAKDVWGAVARKVYRLT